MNQIRKNNNKIGAKRKRSANWDDMERILLKTCVMEFITEIENKNTDTNTNRKKHDAWQTVTQRFNELNDRERTSKEMKSQWQVMKCEEKKEINKKMQPNGEEQTSHRDSEASSWPEIIIAQESETDLNAFDRNVIVVKNVTPSLKLTGLKRKLPSMTNDDNYRLKHWDKLLAKERNSILIDCIKEEHQLKMKNMMETHSLIKEECQLKIEKLKLEIAAIKSEKNLEE